MLVNSFNHVQARHIIFGISRAIFRVIGRVDMGWGLGWLFMASLYLWSHLWGGWVGHLVHIDWGFFHGQPGEQPELCTGQAYHLLHLLVHLWGGFSETSSAKLLQ